MSDHTPETPRIAEPAVDAEKYGQTAGVRENTTEWLRKRGLIRDTHSVVQQTFWPHRRNTKRKPSREK
jgi:hypothetical protein